MRIEHGTDLTPLGITHGYAHWVQEAAPLIGLQLPHDWCCKVLTPAQQRELKEDGFLLFDVACLGPMLDRQRETHEHKVLVGLRNWS